MPPDMVHRDKGLAQRKGQRFAEVRAHQQRTDQAGRAGRGDRVHVLLVHLRIRQRLLGHAHHRFHVAARGDLGHNAAIQRMCLDLRVDHAGKDLASVLDDGCRRLVAGGLNR